MQVRLLGPVDVEADDGPRPVHGPRRMAVLATLALHCGEVVSTGRLAEGSSGASQSDVCSQVCCPAWCWLRSLVSAVSSAASAARPWAVMRTQVRGRRPV